MQSVSLMVHLVTKSPAPQEGPTRPDEDRMSNWTVLQIIVDRADFCVCLVQITQAREDRTYEYKCLRDNGSNLFNQQLKQLANYCWCLGADIVGTDMEENKVSVSN